MSNDQTPQVFTAGDIGISNNHGLKFTGTTANGKYILVSDQLPKKLKTEQMLHCVPVPEAGVLVMSQQMYDEMMDLAEGEGSIKEKR
jgi:hypothetical protein